MNNKQLPLWQLLQNRIIHAWQLLAGSMLTVDSDVVGPNLRSGVWEPDNFIAATANKQPVQI